MEWMGKVRASTQEMKRTNAALLSTYLGRKEQRLSRAVAVYAAPDDGAGAVSLMSQHAASDGCCEVGGILS